MVSLDEDTAGSPLDEEDPDATAENEEPDGVPCEVAERSENVNLVHLSYKTALTQMKKGQLDVAKSAAKEGLRLLPQCDQQELWQYGIDFELSFNYILAKLAYFSSRSAYHPESRDSEVRAASAREAANILRPFVGTIDGLKADDLRNFAEAPELIPDIKKFRDQLRGYLGK